MDFDLTLSEQQFLDEVNGFLDGELANLEGTYDPEASAPEWDPIVDAFTKRVAQRKWLAMAWPREYGGLAAPHMQQMLFNETMSYRRAPLAPSMGISWVGP